MKLNFKKCCCKAIFFFTVALLTINEQMNNIAANMSEIYKVPMIVWWTNHIYPHTGTHTVITCPHSKCISTNKKSYANKNDKIYIVVFYGTDFDIANLPLPRLKNHQWALLHEESPMNNYIFSHLVGLKLFNFTATFSRFSDFPLTTQFIPSLDYLVKRKPIPVHLKNEYRKSGLAAIVYVQSHCGVASDRDRYVKKLMEFVKIDSYGSCLHNRDLPPELNRTDMYDNVNFFDFLARYKFHLTFENAICNDYITEKLIRALHVGSVPIYKGSPSIKNWLPANKSAVIIDDFESPEHLANFILELDKNDDLYESFLIYKNGITNPLLIKTVAERTWKVNDLDGIDFIRGFECYLCDVVKSNSSRKYSNKKNINHMTCPQPHISLNIDVPLSDEWISQGWVESYWFGYDQARVVHEMIEHKEKRSSNYERYLMKLKYTS